MELEKIDNIYTAIPDDCCLLIDSQKAWETIRRYLEGSPDYSVPKKLPFKKTYIKHITYISEGNRVYFSNNNLRGLCMKWIPKKLKILTIQRTLTPKAKKDRKNFKLPYASPQTDSDRKRND